MPSHEHRVRDLINGEIPGLFDSIETDAKGALCAGAMRQQLARQKS